MFMPFQLQVRCPGGTTTHATVDEECRSLVEGKPWRIDRLDRAYPYWKEWNGGQPRRHFLHRVVMGNPPVVRGQLMVDHINRNTLDCRRSNLRLVGPLLNSHNYGAMKRSKSGIRGVSKKRDDSWEARIMYDSHLHVLGTYHTAGDATLALAHWRKRNIPDSAEAQMDLPPEPNTKPPPLNYWYAPSWGKWVAHVTRDGVTRKSTHPSETEAALAARKYLKELSNA